MVEPRDGLESETAGLLQSARVPFARRDGLEDLIGELVEINGPLDADSVARFVDEWR